MDTLFKNSKIVTLLILIDFMESCGQNKFKNKL